MSLTANAQLVYEDRMTVNNQPVKGSTEIFLGCAVGMTAGYARKLNAGDVFAGFCDSHVNNNASTGVIGTPDTSGADGALTVPVVQAGRVQLAIAALAVTNIGQDVYASDDNTFTLAATNNTLIGKCIRYVSSGVGVVAFESGGR